MKPFFVYGMPKGGSVKDFEVALAECLELPNRALIVAYTQMIEGVWVTQDCHQTTSGEQDDLVVEMIENEIRAQGGDVSIRTGAFRKKRQKESGPSTISGGFK